MLAKKLAYENLTYNKFGLRFLPLFAEPERLALEVSSEELGYQSMVFLPLHDSVQQPLRQQPLQSPLRPRLLQYQDLYQADHRLAWLFAFSVSS